MGWQDILKSSEDLIQEFEILFRGFPVEREMTPTEERSLRSVVKNLVPGNKINPYIRSMKYMEDFPEIKRDGLNFVMSFEVYDQTFTLKKSLLGDSPRETPFGGIGRMAMDTFPLLVKTGTRICIKPSGVMTNGDMMVAILLASKNDQLPAIITLPAYVERFFPQIEFHDRNPIFNNTEPHYKIELIRKLLKEVEGLPDEEILGEKEFLDKYGYTIAGEYAGLNRALTEYVPNKVLGRW